jgi:hypothetical protein
MIDDTQRGERERGLSTTLPGWQQHSDRHEEQHGERVAHRQCIRRGAQGCNRMCRRSCRRRNAPSAIETPKTAAETNGESQCHGEHGQREELSRPQWQPHVQHYWNHAPAHNGRHDNQACDFQQGDPQRKSREPSLKCPPSTPGAARGRPRSTRLRRRASPRQCARWCVELPMIGQYSNSTTVLAPRV